MKFINNIDRNLYKYKIVQFIYRSELISVKYSKTV